MSRRPETTEELAEDLDLGMPYWCRALFVLFVLLSLFLVVANPETLAHFVLPAFCLLLIFYTFFLTQKLRRLAIAQQREIEILKQKSEDKKLPAKASEFCRP